MNEGNNLLGHAVLVSEVAYLPEEIGPFHIDRAGVENDCGGLKNTWG